MWRAVASAEALQWDILRAAQLATKMAGYGMDGLEPLLAFLADPKADPDAKTLAVISFDSVLSAPHLMETLMPALGQRLIALTAENYEETTRACATQLVGELVMTEATQRSSELLTDDSIRVRFTATYILARGGDAQALDRVPELWANQGLAQAARTSLVLALPQDGRPDLMPIFRAAAADAKLSVQARLHAVDSLGRHGQPEDQVLLETVAKDDTSPEVRELATQGAQAIASRGSETDGQVPKGDAGALRPTE